MVYGGTLGLICKGARMTGRRLWLGIGGYVHLALSPSTPLSLYLLLHLSRAAWRGATFAHLAGVWANGGGPGRHPLMFSITLCLL